MNTTSGTGTYDNCGGSGTTTSYVVSSTPKTISNPYWDIYARQTIKHKDIEDYTIEELLKVIRRKLKKC